MLDERKIKISERNVKNYLSEGFMKKTKFKKIIFDTYMDNHRESILLANKIFKSNMSNLWVVVISYYSMFYIANAILYKLGYKIGSKISHKVTFDALVVFVKNKLKNNFIEEYKLMSEEALILSENTIQDYEFERKKRSVFQYESTEKLKRAKAKTSLERAKKFSKEIEKLIENI